MRVQFFQRNNGLVDDGAVGALTMAAIELALRALGLLPPGPTPVSTSAVRPITQQILGVASPNNLITQVIPSIEVIAESTFRAGVTSNKPSFRSVSPTAGRLGIFAAQKGSLQRAVILLLPPTGVPDRVIICITQGFAQATATLDPLNWGDPLSPALINFVLLKHVVNRWGAQTLASRKQMAFVYIVRAKGDELGPFKNDGPFMRQVLTEMASLTNQSFSFGNVEAFTFSSGISEFNTFVTAINGVLPVRALYALDPAPAVGTAQLPGVVRKQFLTGATGGPRAGFEFMPIDRWSNESQFATRNTFPAPAGFNYLHNHCAPKYFLHLGLQSS
jgi:hypothetical protein